MPPALSADAHSSLAKDCSGAQGPGLGSPALAILASATVPGKLLCTGLQGPLEVRLLQSCKAPPWPPAFPFGITKMVQRPFQCSPCGIMAEQSWGRRPSSSVWNDGPCPGCSLGAPGQAPAISAPEPPGTPGPRRSRNGTDPGERESLKPWPPSRKRGNEEDMLTTQD